MSRNQEQEENPLRPENDDILEQFSRLTLAHNFQKKKNYKNGK
jgi:hypothetical protein